LIATARLSTWVEASVDVAETAAADPLAHLVAADRTRRRGGSQRRRRRAGRRRQLARRLDLHRRRRRQPELVDETSRVGVEHAARAVGGEQLLELGGRRGILGAALREEPLALRAVERRRRLEVGHEALPAIAHGRLVA
jgi:hypothetical protein